MPPTSPSGSTDLSSQVARLYFERGLSKVDIAARLGISRFRVARLIDGALADGSVRIEYRDIPDDDRALAGALEVRYGLDLCAVAVASEADRETGPDEAVSGAVARLAASVLDGLIGPGSVVGVAWGSTLAAVVRAFPTRTDATLEVVQLAGSSARLERGRDAGELARVLADRLGGIHHPIFAPTFVESAELRSAPRPRTRGRRDAPAVRGTGYSDRRDRCDAERGTGPPPRRCCGPAS